MFLQVGKQHKILRQHFEDLFSVKINLLKVRRFEKFGIKGRNCHAHKNVARNLTFKVSRVGKTLCYFTEKILLTLYHHLRFLDITTKVYTLHFADDNFWILDT